MNFIANDTITLFIWETLQSGGKFHRYLINGVNYKGIKTSFLSGVTNVGGDNVSIVIPLVAAMSKPYAIYQDWLKLADKSTHWTLENNVYIVQGVRQSTATTIAQLEKELKPVKVTVFDYRSLDQMESWSVVAR